MSENKMKKLSEFIEIKHGFPFKSKFISNTENDNILISLGNIDIGGGFKGSKLKYYYGEINKDYILKEGDLVVTLTDLSKQGDTIGYPALLPKIKNKILLHNQRVGLIIFKNDKINKYYLYYLLRSKKYKNYILSMCNGTTVKNISPKSILSYEVKIPTLEEQTYIAKQLQSFDKKIELNTQTNQTLEQIAQAIFKHWFIDFAPVHAKANALARGETTEQAELAAMACLSGKTAEKITALKTQDPTAYHQLQQTAAAFPSEFVETEMGEVPRGWEVKQVKDMGKIICGKTPSKKKEEFYGNDIPFIKIPDMHNNTFIIKTTDNLSLLGANNQKTKFIEKGSICISCIATVGLVSITSERSQTNQQINSIVPNSEIFTEYLYLYFSQDTMNKKLKDLASGGSATLNLNTTAFSNITLLIPNNNLIEFFHKKVQPLFDKILSNKKESISLSDTRDELLPKLLRGEIEL
ncbi:restriction endonuclease subunit S [Avibacterium paragallinarum]|uniref:restriction endonuclease subunit S n=1 Tax=Avibacterium paragallinarum TaxID=728 RepID=UPI0039781023